MVTHGKISGKWHNEPRGAKPKLEAVTPTVKDAEYMGESVFGPGLAPSGFLQSVFMFFVKTRQPAIFQNQVLLGFIPRYIV
uniref:Uncharacterized protein n=1 Tax=Hyaloperonospora arabidopsidis (strain Emoy2) TaxID=559515 RepID=M4B2U6_HYAAE